jgi:hypothetical protein
VRAAEGSGFGDHAHLRGLDVGAVVLSGPCIRARGRR